MPCTFCGSREHSLSRCPWRQARDAWLAMPEGVRIGVLIAAFILIGTVMLPR